MRIIVVVVGRVCASSRSYPMHQLQLARRQEFLEEDPDDDDDDDDD